MGQDATASDMMPANGAAIHMINMIVKKQNTIFNFPIRPIMSTRR